MNLSRLLSLIGCAALSPALAGCGDQPGAQAVADVAGSRAVSVTVASVQTRPVERTVSLVGTLRGWEEVTIGTKRAGRVVRVLHDVGDHVEPGAPLVELETIDAELAHRQAERQHQAELAKLGLSKPPGPEFRIDSVPTVLQARVTLDQTRRELARRRNLHQRNAASLQEVQDAEDAERAAAAGLQSAEVAAESTLANAQAAEIAVQVARQALDDTIIRAPVPSVEPEGRSGPLRYAVTARSVSEGQMLAAGQAVAALAIEDPLRLKGSVPERFVGEIQIGQPIALRVASQDQPFTGQIVRINPSVDPVSRTFEIEGLVRNAEGQLRPGSFAKAEIVTRRDDAAMTVPLESIVQFAGVTKVFVIDANRSRAIQVTTGLEDPDGQWIEVTGPLRTGDLIATSGMSQLADGTDVTVRTSGSTGVPQERAPAPPPPAGTPAQAVEPGSPAASSHAGEIHE